jgi:hypothetical protein
MKILAFRNIKLEIKLQFWQFYVFLKERWCNLFVKKIIISSEYRKMKQKAAIIIIFPQKGLTVEIFVKIKS